MALLDVVLREKRLVRVRAKGAHDLTEQEARYMVVDRILHPEMHFAPPADAEHREIKSRSCQKRYN